MTAREYLDRERQTEFKSEYVDGEVFAMAGATRRHNRIAFRLAHALETRLEGKPCEVYNSDMRLKVEATELYAYPDGQVVCDDMRFEDEQEDVLLNPKIIIEVLTRASAGWDLGKKFWHYRHLDSLAEYVVVYSDFWLVEHFVRQSDGVWRFESIEDGHGILFLPLINCKIPLTEIFDKTGLKPLPALTRTKPKRNPQLTYDLHRHRGRSGLVD